MLAARGDLPGALVALGGAFLAAGLLARLGRRIGLPTIPFFMAAGIITGPYTPGLVLVSDPSDLEVFAAVGLILLLFHLGLEFSLAQLASGGRPLLVAGATTIVLNLGVGLGLGFVLGWGPRRRSYWPAPWASRARRSSRSCSWSCTGSSGRRRR